MAVLLPFLINRWYIIVCFTPLFALLQHTRVVLLEASARAAAVALCSYHRLDRKGNSKRMPEKHKKKRDTRVARVHGHSPLSLLKRALHAAKVEKQPHALGTNKHMRCCVIDPIFTAGESNCETHVVAISWYV